MDLRGIWKWFVEYSCTVLTKEDFLMNYNVRGENIEVTPAIREYVEKKLSKLERYFSNTPDANASVNLKVRTTNTSKVEVTIPMPNLVLRAEEENADMYAAIDLIVDKLERQIRKHKTKINRKSRFNNGAAGEVFTIALDAADQAKQKKSLNWFVINALT